jgi:hypothetical protein
MVHGLAARGADPTLDNISEWFDKTVEPSFSARPCAAPSITTVFVQYFRLAPGAP